MRIRHVLEHLGLRCGLFVIDHLPHRFNVALGRRLADLWYLVDGRRRRLAIDNILRSGIAGDRRAAARIARASFHHLPQVVIESLQSEAFFNETNWRERVELEVPPETMALLEDETSGVILVSGHLGNWEIAAQLLSYLKPVTGITRGMNNPLNDRLLQKRKPRHRFTLTSKHDVNTGRFLTVLREGQVLALLMDQHARQRGMKVDFFGTPASTHTSPALLHLVTGVPMCLGYCVRTGLMRFRLQALPPLRFEPTGDRQADVRRILETLNGALEEAIRQYPDQYLWVHRRWRTPNA